VKIKSPSTILGDSEFAVKIKFFRSQLLLEHLFPLLALGFRQVAFDDVGGLLAQRAGHGFTRQRMCLRLNDCAQARNALTGNLFGSGSCSPQRLHAKPYKDPGFVPSLAIIQG